MSVVLSVTSALLPLYFFALLGWIGARKLSIEKTQIATLVIYLLTPLVMGPAVARMTFSISRLGLPVLVLCLCTLISFLSVRIARVLGLRDDESTVIGAAAGMANSGYFGVPLANAVLSPDQLGVYILAIQGFMLHENLVALYLLFRTELSPRESVRRLFRMPTLWAVCLGIIISASGITIPASLTPVLVSIKESYVVLGMMLLGVALGSEHRLEWDGRFLIGAVGVRMALWVVCASLTVLVLGPLFGWGACERSVFLIIGTLPIAANVLAYASLLNLYPQKVVVAVLLSTLVALPLYGALNFLFVG
jgi:predicted permease